MFGHSLELKTGSVNPILSEGVVPQRRELTRVGVGPFHTEEVGGGIKTPLEGDMVSLHFRPPSCLWCTYHRCLRKPVIAKRCN